MSRPTRGAREILREHNAVHGRDQVDTNDLTKSYPAVEMSQHQIVRRMVEAMLRENQPPTPESDGQAEDDDYDEVGPSETLYQMAAEAHDQAEYEQEPDPTPTEPDPTPTPEEDKSNPETDVGARKDPPPED